MLLELYQKLCGGKVQWSVVGRVVWKVVKILSYELRKTELWVVRQRITVPRVKVKSINVRPRFEIPVTR